MTDAIEALSDHVAGTRIEAMAPEAIAAAKTFILDTLGVGIGGSAGPMATELAAALAALGAGADARVWATGERLPAPAAAWCNAYRAHCQEFDCVHEEAVAHVLTVVLPVALATAERAGGISGQRLIEAVVLGVDVAASLGVAATSGLRFFRPGTVGAFGAVAAMGKIMGLSPVQLTDAFSLVYGQLCGTMQAHTEGSDMLAMQMGFNARNAVTACDLAARGFGGPKGILQGDFGYFRLIEDGGDMDPVITDLGQRWRIAEVAHKPFPSGRATHGILDGCLGLQRDHAIPASSIDRIRLGVPPLVEHLVGRPPKTEMQINYARLCARYVTAAALIGNGLTLEDFTDEAYRRAEHQALAAKIALSVAGEDPNALTPIEITIETRDGKRFDRTVTEVYGSPRNPMSRAAQLEKFRRNCAAAVSPVPEDQVEELITMIDRLEEVADVARMIDLTLG